MQRAMMFVVLILILFSAPAWGRTVDELLRLAAEDALPEVREAAGIALTEVWTVSDDSNEFLRQLALENPATEIRSAAARALGNRLTQSASSEGELLDLVRNGEFVEAQRTAADALSNVYLQSTTLSLDALIQIATRADTDIERHTAVDALAAALAVSPAPTAELLSLAQTGETAALRTAAAQALLSRTQSGRFYPVTEDQFFAIASRQATAIAGAIEQTNPELRQAAADVFQPSLRQSDLESLVALAADLSVSDELRQAAANVLSGVLLDAMLPLEELDTLAKSVSPELRSATVDALVQAVVGALGRLELSLEALVQSVSEADRFELALARAEAVFVLLRTTLVRLENQAVLEALANGEVVTVNGLELDGDVRAWRAAAADFLTGIYTFFGLIDRFEDPLSALTQIASDEALTPELQQAAGDALAVVFRAERQRSLDVVATLNTLLDELDELITVDTTPQALGIMDEFTVVLEAERGVMALTAEAAGDFTARAQLNQDANRTLAAIRRSLEDGQLFTVRGDMTALRRLLQSVQRSIESAPEVSTEFLMETAAQGATAALRQAASLALSPRLARDVADLEALVDLSENGASEELQRASIAALTQAWLSAPLSGEALYDLAIQGTTPASRLAGAQAFVQSSFIQSFSNNALETLANGEAIELPPLVISEDDSEIQTAAADLLVPVFADEAQFNQEALIQLSISGQSDLLEHSAAQALAQRLIASAISEAALFDLIGRHTQAFGDMLPGSPALSHALSLALAHRFLQNIPSQLGAFDPDGLMA